MSSGFSGFMLGTTANAMANMGALFIDFINPLLITGFVNVFR